MACENSEKIKLEVRHRIDPREGSCTRAGNVDWITFLLRRLHPESLSGDLPSSLDLGVQVLVLRRRVLERHEVVSPVRQRGVTLVTVLDGSKKTESFVQK